MYRVVLRDVNTELQHLQNFRAGSAAASLSYRDSLKGIKQSQCQLV